MTQGFVVGHTDADPGAVKGKAELGADHGDFVIFSLPGTTPFDKLSTCEQMSDARSTPRLVANDVLQRRRSWDVIRTPHHEWVQ